MANTYTDLLKLRMPALGDIGWDDEVNDNTEIFEFTVAPVLKGNRIVSGLAPSDGGGLDIDVAAGTVVVDGAVYTLSATTKTCTASTKNYLLVDDTGALDVATTMPTGSFVAIAVIDTDLSSILRFSDARALAQGALAMSIDYTPENYTLDTSQEEPISQHLAAFDAMLYEGPILNILGNGDFQVCQRATSQTASGIQSDDRWKNDHSVATKTHSVQEFTIGQTDVPGNPKYYSRTIVTSGSTAASFCNKNQNIFKVEKTSGLPVILSFYAKADSAKNIASEFAQVFGTGGSPSSNVTGIGVTTYALSTVWQKFITAISIPSIAGKTLGTDGNDRLVLTLWFEAGSDYNARTNSLGNQSGTFEISDVQLIFGSNAKAFQRKSFEDNLAECLPYYEKSYDYETAVGTITYIGSVQDAAPSGRSTATWYRNQFQMPKAITPSVTIYSPKSGTSGYIENTTTSVDLACSAGTVSQKRIGTIIYNPSPPIDDNNYAYHYTADTGY